MKKSLSIFFGLTCWTALILQYILLLKMRTAPLYLINLEYFSYFTLTTNTLLAIYFTCQSIESRFLSKTAILTALSGYIMIVAIIYHTMLRDLWNPQGVQLFDDLLLHSIIPIMVLLYWFLYEDKKRVELKNIFIWLLYPIIYLIFILISGSFTGFYPYPFLDSGKYGLSKVLINSFFVTILFCLVFIVLIYIGRLIDKKGK